MARRVEYELARGRSWEQLKEVLEDQAEAGWEVAGFTVVNTEYQALLCRSVLESPLVQLGTGELQELQ